MRKTERERESESKRTSWSVRAECNNLQAPRPLTSNVFLGENQATACISFTAFQLSFLEAWSEKSDHIKLK
jgi:hypothetical protein